MRTWQLVAVTGLILIGFVANARAEKKPPVRMNLQIRGTGVELLSPVSLRLQGNIYRGAAARSPVVGTYEEVVTLQFEAGMIVGATGEATFHFPSLSGQSARLRTRNVSTVVGGDPATGALLVESRGSVVSGEGLFQEVSGGFASSSLIVLPPAFELETKLRLEFPR